MLLPPCLLLLVQQRPGVCAVAAVAARAILWGGSCCCGVDSMAVGDNFGAPPVNWHPGLVPVSPHPVMLMTERDLSVHELGNSFPQWSEFHS